MSNILVFDTSSSWCSVALSANGTLHTMAELQPRKHAQLIMPMIDEVFNKAGIKPSELDGIAFGKGPGSFTGLRIAISVAQGLSLATGARLYGMSSLRAAAWQAMKQKDAEHVLTITNAHMGEVFYGAYSSVSSHVVTERRAQDSPHDEKHCPAIHCVIPDTLCKPECVDISALDQQLDWFGAGDGFQFENELPAKVMKLSAIDLDIAPLAESMMDIALLAWNKGEFTAPEYQQPVYLRDTVAWKKLSEQPSLLKKTRPVKQDL